MNMSSGTVTTHSFSDSVTSDECTSPSQKMSRRVNEHLQPTAFNGLGTGPMRRRLRRPRQYEFDIDDM
jgi:hypothetical protein